MSRERWGTFSVADHLRRRAFVAEVLLYDRLVIPYPPTDEERQRWKQWNPDLLDTKLKCLSEEMVVKVPWNQWAQEQYKARVAAARDIKDVVEEAQIDHFLMTRRVLAQDWKPVLPEGVTKVFPIAAYSSLEVFEEDEKKASDQQQPQERLAMVLTNKFLVPEDSNKSDDELLKQAVSLARQDDFKEKRAKLHRWQEDIIEQDISPKEAVEEMEEHLEKYNAVVKKATGEVYWKYAFMVIPVAIGIATAPLGVPLVAAAATGLVSVAAFAKLDRKPKIDAGECDAAAMIHDVHKYFKWS